MTASIPPALIIGLSVVSASMRYGQMIARLNFRDADII